MTRQRGFTLVEVLITLVIFLFLTGGVMTVFVANKRVEAQDDIALTLDANLRAATTRITRHLRNAGYGVPESNLANWIPWVTGFSADPVLVTDGASGAPDSLSIASCSYESNITLNGTVMAGSTLMSINDASAVDTANRRLVLIGDNEAAHVVWKSGSAITVDTDVATALYQGTTVDYPPGTPVCVVKVISFAIDTANARLQMSDTTIANLEPFAEGITDLQVETLTAGERYRITLTATADAVTPGTGTFETRQRSTVVTLKNGA